MVKKDFKQENPALSYISTDKKNESVEEMKENNKIVNQEVDISKLKLKNKPPKGFKVNPEFIEVRSQRLQALIQPSIQKALKQVAKKEKTSVNDIVNQALIQFLKERG